MMGRSHKPILPLEARMTSAEELSESLTSTIYFGRKIADIAVGQVYIWVCQGQSRWVLTVLIGLLMVPYCTVTSPPVDKMLYGRALYT